jgi:hypothetical protein
VTSAAATKQFTIINYKLWAEISALFCLKIELHNADTSLNAKVHHTIENVVYFLNTKYYE